MELDLGDMLAALEKQQQAMKARQLNNTKPLSFTGGCLFHPSDGRVHKSPCTEIIPNSCAVGTTSPFHGSGSNGLSSMLKGQQQPHSAPHNPLDSTAPRVKRGKEREIPKVKRPTALKKVDDRRWWRERIYPLHSNWRILRISPYIFPHRLS